MNDELIIGNDLELFFNRESKSGIWEVTYDSTNDEVRLNYFNDLNEDKNKCILMSKKECKELKVFLKSLKLNKWKNYKLKQKT
jgi:hypothetical protein